MEKNIGLGKFTAVGMIHARQIGNYMVYLFKKLVLFKQLLQLSGKNQLSGVLSVSVHVRAPPLVEMNV